MLLSETIIPKPRKALSTTRSLCFTVHLLTTVRPGSYAVLKARRGCTIRMKIFFRRKNLLTENKSVFSLVPRLSTRRFRRLLLSAVARYRSISAVRVALSSKPADGTDEQTDGHLTVSQALLRMLSGSFDKVSVSFAMKRCVFVQSRSFERTAGPYPMARTFLIVDVEV